ncbi:hypothetical protein FOCC_FOCC005803 [Frankliniella occidentalis]|uniref:dihydrofolate reductase n=1 Tax=Frankliniella occidentalis TaxID=133901 RepID=A0A6J1T4Z4_FRAOC|nr:dihydrofolate reductase [Frankliniella occidentalis]KAE8747471.1 hypothetical protein FOCC_FOCC005803 [Frankliniella occidentalis]
MAPRINLIVAACENMGIGVNGNLPWKLKSEMAFFKRMTSDTRDHSKKNMVIMGRRTWDSIPSKFRPLPGRVNAILSSKVKTTDVPEGVLVFSSFDSILKFLQEENLSNQIETAWVIGGSSVYNLAMNSQFCHRIYLTKILKEFQCDTFMDSIDEKQFFQVADSSLPQGIQEEDGVTFQYVAYEKMNN